MIGCDQGYELAKPVSPTCTYSGLWQTELTPECVRKLDKRQVIIVASSVSASVFVMTVACCLLVYRFKYKLIVLSYKYCRWLLCCRRFVGKRDEKSYHSFAWYHDDDDRLMRGVVAQLEEQGLSVFIDARDGTLGHSQVRYIPEAIARSHSVLLYITNAFLEDSICQFVMDQTFYQWLDDESLKVMLLCDRDIYEFKKLPPYMSSFLSQCSVFRPPQDATDKIRYELRSFDVTPRSLQHIQRMQSLLDVTDTQDERILVHI